ncbi:MAG: NAD(P)H-dependent oxidoreductase [Candidatus Bathyarchaeota archaeon]|nr:NAD(P)H-dependent oxidoreductase [Candidatus Bathyarchaeota archaeon]
MNILVILAHPDRVSFNSAIAQTATDTLTRLGHHVIFHDLYAEGFNPILETKEIPAEAQVDQTIRRHCQELATADGIIIIHPNWWGQPPAILKGWIDRVFREEIAYRFVEGDNGEGVPVGLLKAKKAVVFNTSNTASAREQKEFGDPLENLWKNCLFKLCGVTDFRRRMFSVVITSTEKQRKIWLNETAEIVEKAFPLF